MEEAVAGIMLMELEVSVEAVKTAALWEPLVQTDSGVEVEVTATAAVLPTVAAVS